MKKIPSLGLLALLSAFLLTSCGTQPAGLTDGTYEIPVDSSSSMFRVVQCLLTVEGDTMTAAMTMSGQGYGYLYMGTAEEALQDSEDTYIPFSLDEDGAKVFTVPVEALDQEIPCAAWSIKKEKWYDRVLVFESPQLPAETSQDTASLPSQGEYTVEVTLSGGSGRTQISSPTTLSSIGGSLTAAVIFDSPHYEFMEVDGLQFDPVESDDDAATTFSIPVVLDEEMTVKAQTIAMSQPHLIEYTLYFDSSTLQPVRER